MSLPLFTLFMFACSLSVAPPGVQAKHHHHNNNRLMELLTAGIVAKVLQKQEGDEGEHHEYYPVPIHVPVHHHGHGHHDHHHGSGSHHHHVTEKIIPIPWVTRKSCFLIWNWYLKGTIGYFFTYVLSGTLSPYTLPRCTVRLTTSTNTSRRRSYPYLDLSVLFN